MAEYKINEGRYLVSANLGEGFEEYNNTPQKAFEFLRAQMDDLKVRNPMALRKKPKSLFRAKLDSLSFEELAEVMLTMHLEWAWLKGDSNLVQTLLHGDKSNNRPDNVRFIEDFR